MGQNNVVECPIERMLIACIYMAQILIVVAHQFMEDGSRPRLSELSQMLIKLFCSMAANDVYFEEHVLIFILCNFSVVCVCDNDNYVIDKKIFSLRFEFMLHFFKLMVVCNSFYLLP